MFSNALRTLIVLCAVMANGLLAQDVVFIGDHNGSGSASPLYVWETGWPGPVHTTLSANFLQQRGRGVIARLGTGAYAGKVLVFHGTTYGGAFIRTYTPGGGPSAVSTAFADLANFGGSTPIHQIALNTECTRLYLGRDHGGVFTKIEQWDVSNLTSPTLIQTITVPGIETMSLSPDGTRIVGAYAQGGTTIVHVDLTTTTPTVSSIPLNGTEGIRGDIRIEPIMGMWAYFPINDPGNSNERKIGKLNLATKAYSSVSLESLLGGNLFSPAGLAFDTFNDTVYFSTHPAGAAASNRLVYLPGAASGGGTPALAGPLPALNSTGACNPGVRATYAIEFSPETGKLYMTSACNGVYFSEIDVAANNENPFSLPNLGYGYFSLAVASSKPVKLTVKAVPATDPLISVNGGQETNATNAYLKPGSTATLTVNNATQPVPVSTSGPKYDFQKWVKAPETCPGGAPFGVGSMVLTDPLQIDVEDTYCACFEKSWYLNVTVNGSCTATPSGWHPDGSTPAFSVTAPSGTTVTVTGDATASGQTIAMDQPKNVTVNCTTTSGGGGCSPLSSHSDLVGWYRFEEPASQTAFTDSSANPTALTALRTVQRGTGKVGNAIYFESTPSIQQIFTPPTGSAATTTTSPAKFNFGTGAFTIDFWINLNGSQANGRPILQKMSGLESNASPFPLGSPRPPEFGYRLRTIAGEFLELELASNGTFAKYAGSAAMPVNQWVHVTVVVPRGSSLPVFYIDGVPQTASGPATFTGTLDNNAPLLVGDIAGPGTLGPAGSRPVATRFWIDELELFKAALTQADVTGLVSAGSTGKCVPGGTGCAPPPPGMITWYTMDAQATGEADIAGATRTPLNWVGNPQSITGRVGNALRFTTANYAEAATTAEGDITTTNLSVDAWIRTNSAAGVQTFLDKRVTSPVTRGYSFFLSNGRLGFQMADGSGTSNTCSAAATSACTNWVSSSANLADGNWHHVAVTVNRTSTTGGILYVDGQPISGFTFDPTVRSGSLATTGRLRIGNHTGGGQFAGDVDEVEVFDRELTPAEIRAIFDAGPVGKCRDNCAPPPAGMSAWWRFEETAGPHFNDAAGSINDIAQIGAAGIQRVTGHVGQAVRFNTDAERLTVPPSQETQFPGSGGSIDLWVRTIGNPLVPIVDRNDNNNYGYQFYLQNGRPVLKLFAAGMSGTWTSNLTVPVNAWTFVAVTFNRPATPVFYVNGAMDAAPSASGLMPVGAITPNVPLLIGGLRPIGAPTAIEASIDELEIFQRALTTTEIQSIFNAGPLGKCNPPAQPAGLILDTNPAGLNLNYNSFTNQPAPVFLQNVTGNTTASAPPSQVSNGAYYTFQNWTENDPAATPATGPSQPTIPAPPAGQTYTWTANYNLAGYVVTATGCGVQVSPAALAASANPLVFPLGATLFASANPGSGQTFQNFQIVNNGIATTSTTNPTQFTVNGPVTITANCPAATATTVTVNTNPANIGATVGVLGTGTALNNYTNANITPGNLTVTVTPTSITTGQTKYDFRNWSLNSVANPAWLSAAQSASVTSSGGTFTANFDTSYLLTVVVNGNCTVNPQTGYYPAGSTQTVNVTPSAGATLSGITFAQPGGAGLNVPNGGTITMSGPGTLTVNCGTSNINLTLITIPSALTGTIGTTTTTAPFLRAVPSGVAQPVSVPTPQMSGGTGYQFTNWTGPVANTTTAATTVTATTNTTVTANFSVYCYLLTVNTSPSGGGTVQVSPPTGGLSGVPSNCYRPGTQVTLTATPGTGFGSPAWTGATGSGNTATVVLNQPATVTATFSQVTTVNPNDAVFLVSSRAGGNLSMDLSNRGATPIQNLRITAVTNISNGFTLNMTLPRNFAGALNPGANTGFNMLFTRAQGDRDAAFSFTMTVQADNLAPFTRTINVLATATATLAPTAVSRTNTGNVASLVFKVDNSGTGDATQVIGMVAIQASSAGLTVNNPSFSLGTIPAGGSTNVTINAMGNPGSNVSGAAFNVTLIITYINPNLTQTQVTKSWHFDASGGITAL